MSVRQQKKTRTRDEIVSAAVRLFEKHGYDRVTTEQVAQEAGVSRRTLYRYFPTKQHLVFPFAEERLAQFLSMFAALIVMRGPIEAFQASMEAVAASYDNRQREIRIENVIMNSHELSLRQREIYYSAFGPLVEILERHLGYTARARRKATYIAGALVGLIQSAMTMWVNEDHNMTLKQIAHEAILTLANLEQELS